MVIAEKIKDLADSWCRENPPENMKWSWGEALVLYSLARLDETLGTADFTEYCRRYADSHYEKGITVDQSDTCAPALITHYLHVKTGETRYGEMTDKAVFYLKNEPRLIKDLINHNGHSHDSKDYPKSIWADSLMMSGVFSSIVAVDRNDNDLMDFALKQPVQFTEYLRDEKTGLYHHSWWKILKRPYPRNLFWGRGNGWILASFAFMYRQTKDESTAGLLKELAAALLPFQRSDYYFDTVINKPGDNYRESSATALIAAGWLAGIREGVLDDRYFKPARNAIEAIVSNFGINSRNTYMTETSLWTLPMFIMPYRLKFGPYPGYKYVKKGKNVPYGVASLLLAFSELIELLKERPDLDYGNKISFEHDFFRTSGVQDFKIQPTSPPPENYPGHPVKDSYTRNSISADYSERKKLFVEHVLKNPSGDTAKAMFYDLIRMKYDPENVHKGNLFGSIEYVNSRKDCSDFILSGIIRMVKQLSDSSAMTEDLTEAARRCILDFKYWPDEPGTDSMCYWTENHHILFSVNEYLAGAMYPDEIFSNSGVKGREKSRRAAIRVMKWLELRFRSGFIEWLSNVYYDEDLVALLNLVDFAEDREYSERAAMVIDLIFYDMAVNSFYGQFVPTHGRTYTKEKQSALVESTIDTSKLMFGMGIFSMEDNMSAPVLVLSSYTLPSVLYEIANDTDRNEVINRQRSSIRFKDAAKWGYGKQDLSSAMGLLSAGGYSHPRTINHMVRLLDSYGWWSNNFFKEFQPFRKVIRLGKPFGLTRLFAFIFRKDMSRNSMTEANIYTYRTPDYQLSTAQDYRKGYGGDQHHIWQATLDAEAVCFTTHPGGYGMTAPDAYWHGSGYLPRALQFKNITIIQYKLTKMPRIIMADLLTFTHAWLPKEKFDEVKGEGNWYFARKGNAYLALFSHNPSHWQEEGENADKEIIAEGLQNTWICELGRLETNGSFEQFTEKIKSAEIKISGKSGQYESPLQGKLTFGWNKPFRCNGEKVKLKNYLRYDNIYGTSPFGGDAITVQAHSSKLELNFRENSRIIGDNK